MGERKRLGLKHHDVDVESQARLDEIDAVLEAVLPVRPSHFDMLTTAYAAIVAAKGGKVNICLGPEAYQRATESGLIAKLSELYPTLNFVEPGKSVRGCHANRIVFDEVSAYG